MIRIIALLLTVLTGFSGLVYEVAWQKYLATLLGSHSEATAAVLAIFLGGSRSATRSSARHAAARRARTPAAGARAPARYGLVEAGIGVYALLFPSLFGLAQRALAAGCPHGHPALAFAFDVLLSALLIGPPTILMGGTIPMLTQALARDLEDATRFHALRLRLQHARRVRGRARRRLRARSAGSASTARVLRDGRARTSPPARLRWLLGGCAPRSSRRTLRRAQRAAPAPRFAAYAAVALLAGFAMMALQTTLNRVGGARARLLALHVRDGRRGLRAVHRARQPRRLGAAQRFRARRWRSAPVGAGRCCSRRSTSARATRRTGRTCCAPLPRHRRRASTRTTSSCSSRCSRLLGCRSALSGALLPLLFHQLRREVGELGAVAGRLYALEHASARCSARCSAATCCCSWLDLHHVYRDRVGALALAAALLTALAGAARRASRAARRVRRVRSRAVALLPRWDASRLTSGLFRMRERRSPRRSRGPDAFFRATRSAATLRLLRRRSDQHRDVVERRRRARAALAQHRHERQVATEHARSATTRRWRSPALLPALLADAPRARVRDRLGHGRHRGRARRARRDPSASTSPRSRAA